MGATSSAVKKKTITTINAITMQCIVVGDGTVGKTCLLIAFTTNRFPATYIPTVFDNHFTNMIVDGIVISLGLYDTAGQEEYDNLRSLSYADADVFLLTYAINNRISFKNVRDKWAPEVTRCCPNVPFILVGSKMDLRNRLTPPVEDGVRGEVLCDGTSTPACDFVREEEAFNLAQELNANGNFECSALTRQGLHQIFTEAVKVVLKKKCITGGKKRK
eukprot:TRINITY_DN13162_c0_g1_i2.p1 TRINITY_DN13162_c0_g1~~TRINITY_DN13162_c0_g1_i2.p1  ORF type:complete len:218 (-),score=37.25 TRINITY_DN13162_c0_g1_i2:183-836(-)